MAVNIEGVELLPWQKDVTNSYIDDDYKFYIINTSRQIGKSLLITQLVLYSAINFEHVDVGVVSLTYKQVKKIYADITDLLNDTPIIKSNNKSELLIELINGSKIRFLSAQNPDSVRGFTFDYLFGDEFAFYQDGVWGKVLQPTTMAKGKKVILCSTPRGTGNDFHNLFNLGMNPDVKNTISFQYDYTHGMFDLEEINAIRQSLPDAIFKQEYLCQFSDNGTVFKDITSIATVHEFKPPQANQKYYIGIDVGVFNDFTVAIVMDEQGNVVDIYKGTRGSILQIQKEVEDFIRKWNPRKVLVELNNQGVTIYEHLRLKFQSRIEGFKTTAQSKSPLINDLQTAIEEKLISIPHYTLDKTIYEELSNFSFSYSPKTKQITYQALAGCHDDAVISLALTTKLWKEHHSTTRPKIAYRIGGR
jgi:phage FluMu gp28-like protein